MAIEKETVAKAPRGRATRTPLGTRNRLGAKNKDPEFEYRFVNDKDGRVDMFREAGWEPASGQEDVGVSRLSVASTDGTVKSVSVGNGDKAILMKVRKDWFQEDQAAKQELINEKEAGIFRVDEANGQYGKIKTRVSREG